MNRPIYLLTALVVFIALASCASLSVPANPIQVGASLPAKTQNLTDTRLKTWLHADLVTDTIPGISVDRAYTEIIKNKKGKKVVVGVVDSGIDIEHEDLKNIIWTNEDEIPNNGKDDDNNGYIDDVHGWNFLGDAVYENLELTRIVKKGDDGSEIYRNAKAEHEEKYREASGGATYIQRVSALLDNADAVIKETLGKEIYTKEDLEAIDSQDQKVQQSASILASMLNYKPSVAELREELKDELDYYTEQLNYHLNLEFDGRKVVGDKPDDFSDLNYGNNNVVGPDKNEAKHGTHVAGIIAAARNNKTGMDGVAQNVIIMPVRTIPNGDEYDKDVARAIRYAVDNGARVINASFGKYYSPHSQWVRDAIVYAASKDVLIVKAAGNEAYNLDEVEVYPNDAIGTTPEIADNFLTVGALNYEYGEQLVASFSNYGKYNVDVFAPGTKIWATTPGNTYEFLQGTSMAAPAVSGIAALIRSYFPQLTAPQVKQIIMKSALPCSKTVTVGGDPKVQQPFTTLSQTGSMANLYNALILASKVARNQARL